MSRYVLLVTDDHILLRDAQTALRDAGYVVIASSNVNLALHLLMRVPCDAVVADVDALRRADGDVRVSWNLTNLLNSARHAHVILACSHADCDDDRGMNNRSARGYVHLGNVAALLECVQQALSTQGPRDLLPYPSRDGGKDVDDYVYCRI